MFQIIFNNISVFLAGKFLLDRFSLEVGMHEQWAIIGNSGAGKTTLTKVLDGSLLHHGTISYHGPTGEPAKPCIQVIPQQHQFRNKSNVANFYYQQRFNASDADDAHDVESELNNQKNDNCKEWIRVFGLDDLLKKPLIQLSNGEHKRLQLAKAMMQDPDMLVLDNPFIGLDKSGRETLNRTLEQLIGMGKKLLFISSIDSLPEFITHVAVLQEGRISSVMTRRDWKSAQVKTYDQPVERPDLSVFTFKKSLTDEIISMRNVNIRYNDRTILKGINWDVQKGERWCISGHNGSGKSTLLSLISADNPQAFANDIFLFGKKRGSGESIWDIKKNIGFVSPELHLYFDKGETVFNAVASGLYDTIGLFRHVSPLDREQIEKWLAILNLSSIHEKRLAQLSLGEQRVVMLGRCLVKNPPLLILDEPCQGLDRATTEQFKRLIDEIASVSSTTIIYVSHFEEDIPTSINRKLVMEKGSIIKIT